MIALDNILRETEPLIQAIVRSFRSRYSSDAAFNHDDLLQEAKMAIVQGFPRFKSRPDCSSSASLSLWVFVCVTNHLRGLNGYTPNIKIDEKEDVCSEAECNNVLSDNVLVAKSSLLDERYNAAVRIQRTPQRVMQLRKQIVSSWNNGLQDILFKQEECERILPIDKSNRAVILYSKASELAS